MTVRWVVVSLLSFITIGLVSTGLNDYLIYVATIAVTWAIFAVGYDILLGYTGYLSLAHGFIFGVGAYAFAILSTRLNAEFWVALVGSCFAASLTGAMIGLVAFRTRGIYFAVLTLGIGLVGYQLMLVFEHVTGGVAGFMGIPSPPTLFVKLSAGHNNLFVGLVILWVTWAGARLLLQSPIGAACVAVREDQTLAQSLGIQVGFARLAAFAFSSFFCGAAGAFFAAVSSYIGPDSFTVLNAGFHVVVLVVVGGMGTLWGPILGALLLTVLPEVLRIANTLSLLIYAGLLLGCVLLAPQGVAGAIRSLIVWLRGRTRSVHSIPAVESQR